MIVAAAVTVAATEGGTQLTATGRAPETVEVYNPSTTVTVYLGASGVTTTDGYPLLPGGRFAVDLGLGEELYGIVASSTQAVRVFRRIGTSGD